MFHKQTYLFYLLMYKRYSNSKNARYSTANSLLKVVDVFFNLFTTERTLRRPTGYFLIERELNNYLTRIIIF